MSSHQDRITILIFFHCHLKALCQVFLAKTQSVDHLDVRMKLLKGPHCAVFSIIGTLSLSKKPSIPCFDLPLGIPLICSIISISKHFPCGCSPFFRASCSTNRVTSTAHCEWVCMQQPAPLSNAARNKGVHADGFSSRGLRS
jgi:hypothetical protein